MHQTEQPGTLTSGLTPDPEPRAPKGRTARATWRGWLVVGLLLALLLLALLPPLVSLGRYQHRIADSMSRVLGRPVHLDHVTLNLLPVPSFTLENLVIDETPAFGAEPLLRAPTVNARLRLSSLWRHRVEFSRISFTDPSVNLVLNPDGRWNLEGILLQAAHIETAPTGQAHAGETPRFPYIEATGGRINLKLGREKTPFSLTDADFALFLPEPRAWQMRIRAHPARTDTSASDTGILQVEALLHRAPAMPEVPIDLQATWTGAPLGEASRVLFAQDAGFRGEISVNAELHGLLSSAALQLHLDLANLHRADFVPEHTLEVNVTCSARALRLLHSFENLRCSWPVPDSATNESALARMLSDSPNTVVALTGDIPDLLSLASAQLQLGTAHLPASVLLTWLRVLSARIPPGLTATGLFSGTASLGEDGAGWTGRATLEQLALSGSRIGPTPITFGPLAFTGSAASLPLPGSVPPPSLQLTLVPSTVSFAGDDSDPATLAGTANAAGYTGRLAGLIPLARLQQLGASLPFVGDGLAKALPTDRAPGPVRLNLSVHRTWGSPQLWTDITDTAAALPSSRQPSIRRTHPQRPRTTSR